MKLKKILYAFLIVLVISNFYFIYYLGRLTDENKDLKNMLIMKDETIKDLNNELLEINASYEDAISNKDALDKKYVFQIEVIKDLRNKLKLEKDKFDQMIPDYVKYNERFKLIYNLSNGLDVYYSHYGRIVVEENLVIKEVLDKDFHNKITSYPLLTSNNDGLVYIAPFGFELNGDVYLYNFEDETNKKIIDVMKLNPHKDETAKVLKWLDDDKILVIIGFAAGTVTKGGDLYLYDFELDELSLIKNVTDHEKHEEIIDFIINENTITLEIISWHEDVEHYDTRFEEIEIK